jgi:ABC-type transport system substrate-binding protein
MRPFVTIAVRSLITLLLAGLALMPAQGRNLARATTAHSPYGGTLIATTAGDPEDFDPAISYGWQDYYSLHEVFNGLLGYKPDTLTLVPDIAASWPTISNDGLVWTFHLRHGVMFQPPVNREVHASDFKYSWERVLNPKTASPGVTFFLHIAGAAAYNAGKAKDVPGIRVLGPYTLQVRLVKPYVPLKYVMARPFSYVIPHEIADKYPKDFSHHAVGTGAFMLQQWVRDQQLVFVRNPHYFHHGLPYLDKVILKVVPQSTVAILQVQRGEADLITDDIAGLDYLRLTNDPRWRGRLFRVQGVSIWYLYMDTTKRPFNDRLVRQAVAMAIDKQRITAVAAGPLGQVTKGIFPPLMPCYNPRLQAWPDNPALARKALAKAGYPHGFSTTIIAGGTSAAQARPELVIQRDVSLIGIRAPLKMATGSTYATLATTAGAKGIAFTQWAMDFPDPSDFIDPILTSVAAQNGGSNFAFYRNPTVDALAAQADSTLNDSQRCGLYRRIEQMIINDAPWVPIYVPIHATLAAPRLTTFYMSPIWYAFDWDHYQVSK